MGVGTSQRKANALAVCDIVNQIKRHSMASWGTMGSIVDTFLVHTRARGMGAQHLQNPTPSLAACPYEILEPTMKAQQGGGLEDEGGAQEPTRAQEL
jgi:hypothetical protein